MYIIIPLILAKPLKFLKRFMGNVQVQYVEEQNSYTKNYVISIFKAQKV